MIPASLLLLACCLLTADSYCDDNVKQKFGYLRGASDSQLFYWFFESRRSSSTSPTLVYFQGGPGGSSMISLASGNGGPCILNRKGDKTTPNQFSFNTFVNVMYIDQPASVGFSKGRPPRNSVDAAKSTLKALESFFKESPSYNSEVFLIGQSYAGHYIPPLAAEILKSGSLIKLKGVILGNSMVNPKVQYSSMPTMAYKSGTTRSVITKAEYNAMTKGLKGLFDSMKKCLAHRDDDDLCLKAFQTFAGTLVKPLKDKNIDPYDLRLQCTEPPPACRYTENLKNYFNNRALQDYLGVRQEWKLLNTAVLEAFLGDLFVDYSSNLTDILNRGLRVCWLEAWKIRAWHEIYLLPSGKQIGKLRSFTLAKTGGELNFAQVFGAGHNAAEDFPDGVLKLVDDFVFGKYR
ncbi:hypothetical protein FOL47_010186 [Perkinsus chesapeaki]|uniref:Uncharacterized protein n=1 Tax=Perkinsus chesapeaki TaxID=330153 RepID=A0A7J6MQ48_PERCH|nr:hypothetical protein FOL47_010186 [Perkinsus chesapeaki]